VILSAAKAREAIYIPFNGFKSRLISDNRAWVSISAPNHSQGEYLLARCFHCWSPLGDCAAFSDKIYFLSQLSHFVDTQSYKKLLSLQRDKFCQFRQSVDNGQFLTVSQSIIRKFSSRKGKLKSQLSLFRAEMNSC
jgi:hypothetical protein